jgi:hypothetical protein
LTHPKSVTIDPWTRSLYWIDVVGRNEFNVERADVGNGDGRETVCAGVKGQTPFDLAVGEDWIVWTDWLNLVVWKLKKSSGDCAPKVLKRLRSARPMGVAFQLDPRAGGCEAVQKVVPVANPARLQQAKSTTPETAAVVMKPCFNYCLRGGNCTLTDAGIPVCTCRNRSEGDRCEVVLHDCSSASGDFFFASSLILLLLFLFSLSAAAIFAFKFHQLKQQKQKQQKTLYQNQSPPVIVKRNRSATRSFGKSSSGKDETACEKTSSSYCGGDGYVVDLEDCCQMTICDTVRKSCLL